MVTTSVEEQILSNEKSYWEAVKNKDSRAVESLTADRCLVVGADGVRAMRREELGELMKSMPSELGDYGIEDGNVEFIQASDDVAIVAYKVRTEYRSEGGPQRAEAFDTTVWVKRDGEWKCALHTETPAASQPPDGKVA
jgi:ketosteroid isomerase-like protein